MSTTNKCENTYDAAATLTEQQPTIYVNTTNSPTIIDSSSLQPINHQDGLLSPVHLNVGGKFMSVSLSTFHTEREPNNLFKTMLNQDSLHQSNVKLMMDIQKQKDVHFIDCDSKYFTYILDWLKFGIYDTEMNHYTCLKLCKLCEKFNILNLKHELTNNLKMQQNFANQGHDSAQYNLGEFYYNNSSLQCKSIADEYLEKSVEWFEKSALQGNANAQYRIGSMYEEGEFLIQSTEKAFEWYRKSAEQGHAHAQYNIGVMYEEGYSSSIVINITNTTTTTTTSNGNNSLNGSNDTSDSSIKSNYEHAFEWYEKSALQNIPEAQYNLGLMYEHGKGVNPCLEKAIEWFEKSASQGDADAQYKLGMMNKEGNRIVKQSYENAFEWFNKSALKGNEMSQCELGYLYLKGLGIQKDDQKALEWFKKSANSGNIDAKNYLKSIYNNRNSTSTSQVGDSISRLDSSSSLLGVEVIDI